MPFRVASWNINSVRLRLGLVERFLREHQPDVLCLQEIKCASELFPGEALAAAGYKYSIVHGQPGYHGVATVSRLPLEEADRLVDAAVDRQSAELRNQILLTSARNRYVGEQARRGLKLFIRALLEQAKHTAFQPVAAEISFGEEGDAIPALEYVLPDGRKISLHGRIDRIDVAKTAAGQDLVRTVDYKTSGKTLELDSVHYGQSLQLLVYLLAVTEGGAGPLDLAKPLAAAAFLAP